MIQSMRQIGRGSNVSKRKNKKTTQNVGEGGDAADADDANYTITRLDVQPSILQGGLKLRDY